ncbi:TetR/AcrR family transcriptional regulator [Streptomyces sp. NPDC055092]
MEKTTLSLRERKKLATWHAIRTAALELIDEQGYEATTVEQIAAAANVSRATFFNYFSGKESVILDQAPEERRRWQTLMDDRPEDEPLWDSLTAILTGFCESLRDRLPTQRLLKAQSPAFAQSAQNFSEQFFTDLKDWVTSRTGPDGQPAATLQRNLAVAATMTAYEIWPAEEPVDGFLRRLEDCLRQARPGTAAD